MQYVISRVSSPPLAHEGWDEGTWANRPIATIDQFHPHASDHRPRAQVKVVYDDAALYVFFNVQDRYVRCEQTEYLSRVSLDSCVEWFVTPQLEMGYFNFEVNCGGTMLMGHLRVRGHRPLQLDARWLDARWVDQMQLHATLPRRVEPEIADPTHWQIRYRVPYELFAEQVGPIAPRSGDVWRGNFFKCGSKTSHPHYGAWSNIGRIRNFHQPNRFGKLVFE